MTQYKSSPFVVGQLLLLASLLAKYADKAGRELLFQILREALVTCEENVVSDIMRSLFMLSEPEDFSRCVNSFCSLLVLIPLVLQSCHGNYF